MSEEAPASHRAGRVTVCPDAEAFTRQAVAKMMAALETALAESDVARVALSGGSTPGPAYRELARRLADDALHRAKIEWYFVDERCVGPDDERSNYRSAREALFAPARIAEDAVFRMKGEHESSRAAASLYEALLCARFGVGARAIRPDADGRSPVGFDLLVAGMGNDGHTASLFPGTGAVERTAELVTAVDPGGGLEQRISLTRPVLIAARKILILCKGTTKRPVVAAARTPGNEEEIPARLYLDARPGAVEWILDRDAAPNPMAGSFSG